MRAVLQRVKEAAVTIDGKETRSIGPGLMVLLGIEDADEEADITWLSRKIVNMRIFDDEEGKMNWSVKKIDGEIMVVSQFTLHAGIKKGNRPSYMRAAKPDVAIPLYQKFVAQLEQDLGKSVTTGEFGAHMDIDLINDGPVTIIADTKNKE